MKRTLAKLLIMLILTGGCKNDAPPRIFLCFIDYSLSASTFEEKNQERLLGRINRIWSKDMKITETLLVYPIHLLTETASTLFRCIKPVPPGDLTAQAAIAESLDQFQREVSEGIFGKTNISNEVRRGTNLYAVLRKIERECNKSKTRVLIVSDMIHEFEDEELNVIFSKEYPPSPREFANTKCQELGMVGKLVNAEVSILIPGTADGDINDELIRPHIITFWEELFTLAGASVQVEDL